MCITAPRSACRLAAPLLATALLVAGCSEAPPTPTEQRALVEQQRQLIDQERRQLSTIPTPTKSQYMTIHNLTTWNNPYLTVQQSMITIHVTVADANTSSLGEGGLLRPRGARQQVLTIRPGELPAALNAVPSTAWPYGRVIAVEEAHNTPRSAEAEVRRTTETVMRVLNDLGVVAYEWPETGSRPR